MKSAVFLLATLVSWACAFPVMFLTYEESEDGNPRLLECVSGEGSTHKLSYKCRVTSKAPTPLGKLHGNDIPVLEILKETLKEDEDGFTAVEINDEVVFPQAAVGSSSDDTKYEVIEEPSSSRKKKNRGGCDDDEVFVAELDICMPYAPHRVQPKIATVKDDDEPVPFYDPSHTILRVGKAKLKCPPGQIEIKDLGICAPINNCWPHPDCSHLEQNKGKNKGNKNQSTRVEEDD